MENLSTSIYLCVTATNIIKLKNYSLGDIKYYTPKEKAFGYSYGEWTVKWWQWVVSSPIINNPVLDYTGKHAGVNQSGPVWFLAGTFGENKMPVRRCTVPFGKALLFPVINYEINHLEDPRLKSKSAMVRHVVEDINDIVNKVALVDGLEIPVYRVQSHPKIFELNPGIDNCLDIPPGQVMAAADGYWAFLKPLQPGRHEIFFHGSCAGGLRNATAKYQLTVLQKEHIGSKFVSNHL